MPDYYDQNPRVHPSRRLDVYPNAPRVSISDPRFPEDTARFRALLSAGECGRALRYALGRGFRVETSDVPPERLAAVKAYVRNFIVTPRNPQADGLHLDFFP